jgi:hypothetical protein
LLSFEVAGGFLDYGETFAETTVGHGSNFVRRCFGGGGLLDPSSVFLLM